MASKNKNLDTSISFLGAGTYDHAIPSVVPHLQRRSEFVTSYTPYQPEVSQGMLQAIYEFQTMICQITGLDIANASLYDGATALVEAVLLAVGPGGRGEVVISQGVDPQYRRVLHTYAHARGFSVKEVPTRDGVTSSEDLDEAVSATTSAVVMQQPNFFGSVEDMHAIEPIAHKGKAVFITNITEPASLGILAPPGDYGADIAVGEIMSFGNTMSYGGPALGFMSARSKYMRLMPGRLVGQTVEESGSKHSESFASRRHTTPFARSRRSLATKPPSAAHSLTSSYSKYLFQRRPCSSTSSRPASSAATHSARAIPAWSVVCSSA